MSSARETKSHRARATILKPVLLAVGSVLLIFVAFEVVERLWLQTLEMKRLHVYQRLRVLLSSLVAALLAGWLILRVSPPLFAPALDDPERGAVRYITEAERQANYAQWFVLMRWIAVVVAALLIFFAVGVVDVLPGALLRPLMITVGVLALMNLMYALMLRAGRARKLLLYVQAYGDLLVLTVLLHLSGGVENPLAVVTVLHVIIAGIIFSRRNCYLVATAASVLFTVMVWAEFTGLIAHYTLSVFPHHAAGGIIEHAAHDPQYTFSRIALQLAILFLTAYFATTITDQLRRDEKALEEFADRVLAQSQLLERALDTTRTALCVCDRELRPSWSNQRWGSWFGGTEPTCVRLLAEDGLQPAAATLEDGQIRVTEIRSVGGLRQTEEERRGEHVFLLTTAPLLDKDGHATHVVELAQEITDQKKIQAHMMDAERLAAVGEIAGKVAHEVNNPIAVISAKARLLLSDPAARLTRRTAEELTKITEMADRVARIAQGLLSSCRPTFGPPARVDIRLPIRKALGVIEHTAAATGVAIVDRLPANLPPAHVNAAEMQQVFVNLFLNAVDAMPGGGQLIVSAHATRGSGTTAGSLLIDVEDTGCGIPVEMRDRAFEPFFTTKPEGRGTGLGLSVCRGLLTGNGGTIELTGRASGRGTRALIRIPIYRPDAERDA